MKTGLNAGGAIVNFAALTLENVSFVNNRALGSGGAIVQQACTGCLEPSLVINHSTFTGNTAGNSGGAINAGGGLLTITDSTFNGNSAGSGGALDLYLNTGNTRTLVSISESTFVGNNSSYSGGAIYQKSLGPGGSLSIANSTFTGNTATGTTVNPAAAIEAEGVRQPSPALQYRETLHQAG